MKKLRLLMLLIFVFLISINRVNAKEVTVSTDFIDGVYSNRQDGAITYWGKFAYIKIDGIVGYCVDPKNIIDTTNYYTSEDFSKLSISSETLSKLENYAYYGYGYKNHTTKEYYMATQQLIWEEISNLRIYYTTGARQSGDVLDISSYMEEIKNTIASKNIKPDIPSKITGKIGKSIMIEDKNSILDEYELENNSENVYLDGNKLIVNFTKKGLETITLKRKARDNYISFLCLADSSQTVSLLGLNNQEKINITIETKPIKKAILKITKKNSNTNEVIEDKVKYKIKNINKNLYLSIGESQVFTSNDFGILELPFYIEEGNYSIEEIEAPNGYYKSKNKVEFSIDDDTKLVDNKYLEIDFYNKPILSKLIIKKLDGNTKEPLKNVRFEIYDALNNLLDTVITDENGQAVASNLMFGTYYVKEIEAPDGYINNDIIEEVKIDKEEVELNIFNQKVNTPNTSKNKHTIFSTSAMAFITIGLFIIKKFFR